ncbi:MAG TPA: lectin-like protein, partial [Clostridia bacterium]
GNSYAVIDQSLSWSDSKAACEALGGHLVTITSETEQHFINSITAEKIKKYYWTGGLQPDGSSEPSGGWTWITGEKMEYTNWESSQPDNYQNDNYLIIAKNIDWHGISNIGKWGDAPNSGENLPINDYGYICEWENNSAPISVTPEDADYPSFNGHVYHMVNKALSWDDANKEASCLTYNGVKGHLATMTSVGESEFIYSTWPDVTFGYWLGGFQQTGSSEPSGGWQWITGEPWEYTNWSGGEPNNSGGNENYLHYWSSRDGSGGWNDIANNYSNIKGYIVEFDTAKPIDTQSIIKNPLNNHSYAVLDKSMTWPYAKEYCEKLGGHLATITSQSEQEFIYSIMANHSKNDYWLGGFQADGSSEPSGGWQWVTKEDMSYTNWSSGKPDNYNGENRLTICVPYETKWNDDSENGYTSINQYGLICEWENGTEIPASSLSVGLKARYKFDGNTKNDVDNTYNGAVFGTEKYSDAVFNKGLELDGNTYVNFGDYPFNSGARTISFWLKYDAGSTGPNIFSKHRNTSDVETLIRVGNPKRYYSEITVGGSYYNLNVKSQETNSQTVFDLITESFDGKQIKIYVNGEQKIVQDTNGAIVNNDWPLILGTNAYSPGSERYIKGIIDDLRIYDRALSNEEIYELYSNGLTIENLIPSSVSAPYGLKIKGLTGSTIKLTWNASSDPSWIKEYRILRDGKEIGTSATNEFKDTNLTAGTSYTYSVKAVDKIGNVSKECESISATPIPPSITGFDPVSGSTVGGSKTQEFKLIFADNNNTEGLSVKVEMSTDNLTWAPLSDPIVGPSKYDASNMYYTCSINLSNVNSGIYYIKATLTDASGFSDIKTFQYTIDRTAPLAPKELCAIQSAGNVGLSWRSSVEADVASYKIYRKDSSGNFTFLASVDGRANTSFTDKNLSSSINYTYKITAVDKFGQESSFSDEVSCTPVSDTTAPVVLGIEPAGDSEIGKNTPIIVRAEDNLSLSSIKLQYSATGKDNWTDINEIKTSGTAAFSLSPSLYGEVYVRAIAKDTSGNESNGTPIRKYTIDTNGPKKVVWKNYIPSSNKIILNWNDVSDSDFAYFQIEQKDSPTGGFKVIGTESSKIGFAVNNLLPDTTYYFRVTAYDINANKGTASDELAATTSKDSSVPVITNLSPSSGCYSKVIHLSGAAADDTGITGFKFQISNDKISWSDLKEFTGSSGFAYDLDISGMKDGSIYIRGIAKDTSGNFSNSSDTAPFVQYIVKNTPPSVPSNVRVTGTSGRITLEWNQNAGDTCYNVYKAASSSGPFSVVAGRLSAIGYSDLDVAAGKSYFYKVSAIDSAGNEGISSEAITASLSPDTEIPKIVSIYPGDGSVLPASPDIRVLSSDNYSVAKVTLEYQAIGSTVWNKINDAILNSRGDVAAFKWNTSSLGEGSYTIRAVASDSSGNVSTPATVKYTLNLSAPKVPVLSTDARNWSAQLSWTSGKEDDLAGFRIYRSLSSGKDYTQVSQFDASKASWTDEALSPAHTYYYKVEAVDIYQNSSFSNEVLVTPLNIDSYAPAAEAGDDMQTTEGLELQFDGTKSRDNDGIASYSWDFGDGEKSSLPQPKHIYSKEGQYTVKLTVSDFSGNTASDTLHVTVFKYQESGILNVTIVDDSTGVGIPGASVVIKFSDDSEMKYITDSQGTVKAAGKIGDCCIYGYKDQYKPNLTYGNIIKNFSTSTTLKLVKGKLIDGKLTVKRMNLEEIVSAGIDPYKPENQWIYKFETHLAFTDTPVAPIVVNGYGQGISGFTPFRITNTVSSNTVNSNSSSTSYVYPYVVPNPGHPEVAPNVYYLVIPGEAKWLKEFFEVGLTMTNTSEASTPFVVTDSTAKLNVPDGLTLIPTTYSDSSTVKIGDLNPGETKEVKWVVRGDKKGEYSLDADFAGILQPFKDAVKANFKTDSTFKVWGDDALRMHIDAQERADKGYPYHVRFGIENVSDTPLYNVSIVLKDNTNQNYIYAPDQNLENSIKELPAGKTIWLDSILIPSITGKLDLSKSYTLKTGSNDANVASDITSHADQENYPGTAPVLKETHNSDNAVTLSWDAITGAVEYRIYYIRKDLYMSGLAEMVADVDASKTSITLPESEARNYIITTMTSSGEALKHGITGLDWCPKAGEPVITIDPMELNVGKSNNVMITVNKDGYPVKDGTVDIGSYIKGQLLDSNGQAKVTITPTMA